MSPTPAPAIKILFLSANPAGTAQLNLDEEVRLIGQRIRRGEYRKLFDLRLAPALRATDLPYELLDHSPDVVHFSGHGSASGELLLVRDGDREAQPISAATLGRVFRQLADRIKCVVLNACYSESQARAIVESIPCVIGMSRAVPDDAAIAFAAGFYEALAFGKSIADAFELGLAQIELAGCLSPSSVEIPRLLVRPGEDAQKLVLARQPATDSFFAAATAKATPTGTGGRVQKIGRIVATGQGSSIRIGQYGASGAGPELQELDEVAVRGEGHNITVEQSHARPESSPNEKPRRGG